jgi:peptidoglycan/LPS O-acetylase OafA/YrhL
MARQEIKGLDTLRFAAAGIVALGHGASFPVAAQFGGGPVWARLLSALDGVSFDGLAAVLVFFVISGFCIHFAPASGAPFDPLAFWTRRILRISGPLVAALALANVLGPLESAALGAVIWSVYCELIYYALYPLLRVAFRRFGIARVLAASCVISAGMIGVGWSISYYWGFGIGLTWLVAAPAWLLGCLLAEQVASGRLAWRVDRIWAWRVAVWLYSAAALAIFFHAPVKLGFPALLFPFQFLAYGWVLAEIEHFRRAGTSGVLEWCGRWSYSLYLVHNIAIAETPVAPHAVLASWLVRLALIIGGSLAFYGLIEAPSHWIARQASRKVAALRARGRAQPSPQLAS